MEQLTNDQMLREICDTLGIGLRPVESLAPFVLLWLARRFGKATLTCEIFPEDEGEETWLLYIGELLVPDDSLLSVLHTAVLSAPPESYAD